MKKHFAPGLAVLVWFALVLQLYVSIRWSLQRGMSVGYGVWMYFAFFSVITNLLVAMVLTLPLIRPQSAVGRFFARSHVLTTVATSIVLVCIAYNLLLRQLWNPHGAQLVAEVIMHDVMPVLFLIYWWLRVPRGSVRWGDLAPMSVYPIAYFGYAMLRGAVFGFYPYPFINVAQLGYERVITNALAILVGYLIFATILIALKRKPVAIVAGT